MEEHTIILSRQLFAELADVITWDKFAVTRIQANRFLSDLKAKAEMVKDNPRFKIVIEDPDDDIVINAAYVGKADYIVTGDKHLLAIRTFKKTQIVTVTEMLELMINH